MSSHPRHAVRVLGASIALALTGTLIGPSLGAVAAPGAPAAPAAKEAGPLTVAGLTVNGRVDPLGIGGEAPVLGWHSESTARGQVQSAYEVRVGSTRGADDVWATGKVASDQQVDVRYAGPALTAGTRYHWQVRVWDGAGEASDWSEPAWFETGLLDADDWGGAQWIAEPSAQAAELARWSDYRAEFDFTLDNLAFAPFIRSRDLNNGYMWQISVADGTPRFRPHRRTNGGYALLGNVDISATISRAALLQGTHTLAVEVEGSRIRTWLDGTLIDDRTDGTHRQGFVGFRSDLATEGPEGATVHEVRVRSLAGDTLLETDFSDGNPFGGGTVTADGLEISGRQDLLWQPAQRRLPLLRRDFSTTDGAQVASARMYAAARGVYALSLNGERVGDLELAPGWTDYRTEIQHQTYDVTDLVRSGANTVGAEIADGWWAGKVAHYPRGSYGDRTSLLTALRIDYTDGTHQWVRTDEQWRTHQGPYVAADLIDGETYDARHAVAGWSTPGTDTSAWTPVTTEPSATALVEPQPDEPVRVTEERPAQARTEPAPGAFVYDLGQNMVGVARMRLTGRAGQTVRIRYGEELNQDGTLYTANLRSAKVTDYYTFAGDGTITYTPRFTFHGFRYLEITGVDSTIAAPPATGDVTGLVWGSDLRTTGSLETSSPMLNQLQSNITWGQRGNFLSIPTDTPARDERLGWTGDINVFAPTASFNQDTRAFLRKWLRDLRVTQRPDGEVSGIAPDPRPGTCCGGGTGWSDAMITVPHTLWMTWGDTATVRENYPAMKRFMGYVEARAGASLTEGGSAYLDWLHLDDPTPARVLGTAYYAETTRMMAEMAEAIGETDDAARYADLSERVRAAFAATFVQDDGTITGNSQAGYAMALGMDLVPAEKRDLVADRYVAKIEASGGHLRTGFLGTPWLLTGLSSTGRNAEAFTLLNREEYPSWGFEVAMGATTMWERWNSIMPDGSFGDVSMNSFNHYAYGAVGDWMYRNIGGIAPTSAGYRSMRIAPLAAPGPEGGNLTSATATLESAYGTIGTDWELTDEGLRLAVDVPVGTTAEVVVPAPTTWAVTEGGVLAADADGVTDVRTEDGSVVVAVGSGSYELVVHAGLEALGALVDRADALSERGEQLAGEGDLDAEAAARLDRETATVRAALVEAVQAAISGDDAAVLSALAAAHADAVALRAWLAESAIARPVRGELVRHVDALIGAIESHLATLLGVDVEVAPSDGSLLPGQSAAVRIDVANSGDGAVQVRAAELSVGPWSAQVADLPRDVAARATATLEAPVRVPATAEPQSLDVTGRLQVAIGDTVLWLQVGRRAWAEVGAAVALSDLRLSAEGEQGSASVLVRNPGSTTIAGQVELRMPAGAGDWQGPLRSGWTALEPGAETRVPMRFLVPVAGVDGTHALTAAFVRSTTTLATTTGELAVAAVPPAQDAELLDHVDLGDAASESAHGLTASQHSGTATEAGLTRRYTHQGFPGGWFQMRVDVTPGEPFVLAVRDTFNGAVAKRYEISVDGTVVDEPHLVRTETGEGVMTYRVLVDDPALLDNDGTVQVRFEHPAAFAAFHDPSIADLWVLPLGDDVVDPLTSVVPRGAVGERGWWTGPVELDATAFDNRAGVSGSIGTDAGWRALGDPLRLDGDGVHEVSLRAVDAAGRRSATEVLEVGIDTTAPRTTARVTPHASQPSAAVALSAADEVSGVAATRYRVDGGAWSVVEGDAGASLRVEGAGTHLVEFASTDLAGNAEVVQRAEVVVAEREALRPVTAPRLRGSRVAGGVLTVDDGSWNASGVQVRRQWLRDGRPIWGFTGTSYRVRPVDVGRTLGVRITASHPERDDHVLTREAGPALAATPRVAVQAAPRPIRAQEAVRVTVRVSAPGVPTGGRVTVRLGARSATGWLRDGVVSVRLRAPGAGRAELAVSYAGTTGIAARTVRQAVWVR